ncbi:TPM domain-containing protein [Microvirga alba]|uniref:YgcG family protein n=1 Tax=Microvirga alba TaxID=2791025 RepID=A0A931FRQ4_9HYPH|nr:YgcG family protein [Microvirga alba]MBF9232986.1 YgcG family protein [Microvirga alba]
MGAITRWRPSPLPGGIEDEGRKVGAACGIRWEGKCTALLFALLLLLIPLAALAQTFPPLSGRVVDAANLLKPEQRAALEAKLKAYEDKTSDQVVVATVPSLEGYEIEDYGNRLYRQWQLGQKDKNNGALLLVAPKERKVRIEVGYGLEGALTDALSKVIITTAIAPQFQKGDFAGGINAGTDAMLSILTGDAEEWQRRAKVREDESTPIDPFITFLLFLVVVYTIHRMLNASNTNVRSGGRRGGGWIIPMGGGGWSSGGGGWSGGGGFSGGGGSSGGGGASGSW